MKTKKIIYLVCMLFGVMLSMQAHSQAFTATGCVKDGAGIPMPGVSIQVKGTTTGTATNAKGEFSLKAEVGKTLVVSFVGYAKQEVSITGTNRIDIVLQEDSKKIDEVVVVGYGTQKKANLTGSVSTVSKDKLENRSVPNAIAALQGTMSGVTITRNSGAPGNEGLNIQVRGLTSVNGATTLVIIDGVPGSLSSLNPSDIDNISVLKDAAAASIYGSRAAAGVILVTTKKGKAGKIKVDYSGLWGITTPANMPERLNSWEEGEMQNIALVNSGASALWTDEQLQWMKDPINNWRVNPKDANQWEYYDNVNWIKEGTKKRSSTQNHNVSISGGNDKTTYMMSYGYYQREGILRYGPDQSDRSNVRFNVNNKFSDYISLDTRLAYTNELTKAPSASITGDYGLLYTMYNTRSIYSVYDPNGGYNGTLANPVALMKEGGCDENRHEGYDFSGNLTIEKFIPNLKINILGARKTHYYDEDLAKRTINYLGAQGKIIKQENATNSLYKERQKTLTNSLQAYATYDINVQDIHKATFIGGYAFEEYRSDLVGAGATSMVSNDFFSLNWGDASTKTNKDEIGTWATMSGFGRLNYSFKDKYLFEANVRVDGSSRLSPSKRWGTFPSFSAAWKVSSEPFIKDNLTFISDLKLRASWGQLGNAAALGYYDYIGLLKKGTDLPVNDQKGQYIYQSQLASSEKTWETVETSNVGVDFSVMNGKLSFVGDYYVKRNKEMLAAVQVPSSIGISLPYFNVGELKTWGWEINLKWSDKIDDFSYWVNFNLSDSQNKLVKYMGKNTIGAGLNQLIEGYPINTIWGYKTDGYFQTNDEYKQYGVFQSNQTGAGDVKYIDLNGDKKISAGAGTVEDHGDLVKIGDTAPRYNFGFDFGCNWKGFDFSAFLQGVGKRYFLMNSLMIMPFYENWRMPNEIHKDYWTPENPNAYWPRLYRGGTHNYLPSEKWTQNGAYVRLKNIQLGYTLPQVLTQKVKIEKIRVYVSGQDLWEKSKVLSIYDPETPSSKPNEQDGNFIYPFYRVVSFGVNVTF